MGSAVNQRQGAIADRRRRPARRRQLHLRPAAEVRSVGVEGHRLLSRSPSRDADRDDPHGRRDPLYVWFVAQLVLAIRGPFGVAVALGGLLVAAAAATGDALTVTATHAAKFGGDPQTIRFAYEASSIAYGRLLWGAIAVAVPLALAVRAGALRSWLAPVLYVQAALMFLGGLSLKSSRVLLAERGHVGDRLQRVLPRHTRDRGRLPAGAALDGSVARDELVQRLPARRFGTTASSAG